MSVGFIRRFLSDPGLAEITAIEGVVVIDREPPASITGVGSGTACIVGEFENGPFETPTEVAGGGDLLSTFGGFGFTYDSVVSNNPCARSRNADSAIVPEYWNGNGFISLVNKKFNRLIVCRVDTSVGSVAFTRLAALSGSSDFTFDLEPSQTVIADLGLGTSTATFTATAALINSGAGTYPSTFVGGEQITFKIDGTTYQAIFLAGDQTQVQVVARLNTAAGYTAFTVQGGNVTRITGRQRGTGGSVQIVSLDAIVATATGFVAATPVAGTGNVANIDAVTLIEANAVISAAITGTVVDRDANGKIRISNTSTTGTASILISPSSTVTAFGWLTGYVSNQPSGYAVVTSGTGAYPTTFAGGEVITIGIDGEADVTVTFTVGDQTITDVINRINAAFGYTIASTPAANKIRLVGRANGGQVRIISATALVLTKTAFVVGATNSVGTVASTIPAGTRVRNTGAVEWVTMQDIAVTATSAGPYSVKVRPAVDDGTALTSLVSTVTVIPAAIQSAAFSVTNTLPLTAALTEAQIDAKYVTAIGKCNNVASVAKQINLIASARQSNACRSNVKTNALESSSAGSFGRVGFVRPPLKTTRTVAKATGTQPGVGAYRDQRVIYCYPGAQTFVPQIAARGTAGGTGFTSDGLIDTGFDAWVMSLCSQLPPEENPGQETAFLSGITAIETGNADVQSMTITDYTAFRASGICALRIDAGVAFVQSGVTSVDPATQPNLRNIARRRMADFIQDTLSTRLVSFNKKLATKLRRALILGEIDAFMRGLLSPDNPALQRIDGYLLDGKSGNTADTLAAGVYRIILKTRTLASLDSIVLDTEIGESVTITETG